MTEAEGHRDPSPAGSTAGEVLYGETAEPVGPVIGFPPGGVVPTVSRAAAGRLVITTGGSSSSPLVPRDIVVLSRTRVALTLHRIIPVSGISTADARLTAYVLSVPGLSQHDPVTVEVSYSDRDGVDVVSLPPAPLTGNE